MENEFQSYTLDREDCCRLLQECIPKCRRIICETFQCCCSCFNQETSSETNKVHFPHVAYRPLIDSNVLTGNTLFSGSGGIYYFPQTHKTIWPEHGSHYKPSPVISEQPRVDNMRKSSRLRSVLKVRAPQIKNIRSRLRHNPASPLPSLAHSSIEDPDQPTLTFASMHDIQASTLTVMLKFGSNLNQLMENMHKIKINPSVTAYLKPSKNEIFHTDIVSETYNPVFSTKFVFTGVPVSELPEQTLVFQVYHDRNLIGITKVPLNSTDLFGYTVCKHIDKVSEATADEAGYSAGDIQIALTYYPDVEVIRGVILRISNLHHRLLHLHAPRPYVNVHLTHDGDRYAKWKSSVQYDTAVPVFNEEFQFNISKMDLNLIKLIMHIKEYHRMSFNNMIGTVEIGATAVGRTGCIHWQDIVNSPLQKISHWHTIVPLESSEL